MPIHPYRSESRIFAFFIATAPEPPGFLAFGFFAFCFFSFFFTAKCCSSMSKFRARPSLSCVICHGEYISGTRSKTVINQTTVTKAKICTFSSLNSFQIVTCCFSGLRTCQMKSDWLNFKIFAKLDGSITDSQRTDTLEIHLRYPTSTLRACITILQIKLCGLT